MIVLLFIVHNVHSNITLFFCKTVRLMLSDRCLSCLSVCLDVMVYCGQMVG